MGRLASRIAVFSAVALALPASAADYGGRARYAQPNADENELAALAPPATASTEAQTYGDAAIARAHVRRRIARLGAGPVYPDAPLGIVPCEPRVARATGYGCHVALPHPGYGDGYAFTPAYLTSPQVKRFVPSVNESMLPPATAFFLGANDALFGRNN